MSRLLLGSFLFTICFYLTWSSAVPRIDEAYHWKVYKGKIPHDAYRVGTNNAEDAIYIAQVLYRDLLVPGEIVAGRREAVFEWGNSRHTTANNVMILCSNNPTQLRWESTSSFLFKSNGRYIVGGSEGDSDIFIGRGIHDDERIVGKVVVDHKNTIWLHAVHENRVVRLTEFEVLSFAPPEETEVTEVIESVEYLDNLPENVTEISFSKQNGECDGGNVVINFNF
uniref:Farnesoic acid O-methyl transferase domain-containing protein n=1 Tax=Photinus pyralis TaxID=7054 RepID=A0A1Y1NJD6_PHOPY